MVALSVLIEDNPIEAMADDMEKAKFSVQQLMLFYPTMPHDVVAAMEYLVSFYQYDESASFASEKLKRESGQLDTAATRRGYEHNKRFFSFEHDSDMIASAFYQQYHIDVVELKQLHWYVFKSLFAGLTDQTIFVKAMQFRQMKISNEMSKSEKAYYRKMKRLYALPISAHLNSRMPTSLGLCSI